jgi:ATP-dependent protease HslVU (ClpYQ) peptidase subunit
MTIAETIANMFHNDGQCFKANGKDINQVAQDAERYCWKSDEQQAVIHVFDDNSMIVIAEFWDVITIDNGFLTDGCGGQWGIVDIDGDVTSAGWRWGRSC